MGLEGRRLEEWCRVNGAAGDSAARLGKRFLQVLILVCEQWSLNLVG